MPDFYDSVEPTTNQERENKLVRTALTKLPEPFLSGLKLDAEIEINGLTLNTIDANNVVWVVTDIDGWWNLPDSEIPDLPRGWGDGSYDAVGRWANRTITLTGAFMPQSPEDAPAARNALMDALSPLVKTAGAGYLVVTEDGTTKKAAKVRLSGTPLISSVNARGRHDFSIGLRAVDPIKYEFVDGDPDGYQVESLTADVTGTASTTINNVGNVAVPIIIETTAALNVSDSNNPPTITNVTRDETLTIIQSANTASKLEIDTYNREVLEVTYATRTVTGVSTDGEKATYTVNANHGLTVGDYVSVTGITPSSLNVTNAEVLEKTALTFKVASTVTDTYTSGGSVESITAVANARAKIPVIVDYIYLNPGVNTITLQDFDSGEGINIYYRSGWIG